MSHRGRSSAAARPRDRSRKAEHGAENVRLTTLTASPDPAFAISGSLFPRVGQRLGERFHLLKELGSGATGVVFLAHDEAYERDVALKVLRHTGALARFKREYRRLCDVAHPHVVTALELHAACAPAFLVMPYVEGRHLDHALFEFPLGQRAEQARSLVGQLALGLDALHREGLVHRDVKPSNVLVSKEGFVRLIDFGLAIPIQASGAPLHSTPAYVAPELVEGRPATPASDWYAFGVVLYQVLSGRLPFVGTPEQVLRDKCAHDAPALSDEVHAAAPELAELAARLLARSPAERPNAEQILRVFGVEAHAHRHGTAPFLGRERELARLDALYEEVKRGTARAVEIAGPSGIGKTSLVQKFVDRLEMSGERPYVFSHFCYENEHSSFKAIDEVMALLPEAATEVSRVDGAPSSTPSGGQAHASVGAALAARLLELQREAPVLVLVDQVQWADADSARVLSEAWPALQKARVLLLFLVREDQRAQSAFIQHIEGLCPELLADKLLVGELADEARTQLVQSLGGPAWQHYESAGGNPMILSWMARGDGSLRELDEDARALGRMIALAGHPLSLRVLERAACDVHDVVGTARRLEARRWITKVVHRGVTMVAPAHDWTRSMLGRGVDRESAREVHLRLGHALESTAAPPEEVGEHYYLASAHDALMPHALQAAQRARDSRAFRNEALWLERILEGTAVSERERDAIRLRAAAALGLSGLGREAAAHYLALTAGASRVRAAELRLLAAEQLFRCGEHEAGYAELRATLARLDLPLPGSRFGRLAGLLWTRARLRWRHPRGPLKRDAELEPLTVIRIRAYAVATLAHLTLDPLLSAYCASRRYLMALGAPAGDHMLRALSDELAVVTGSAGTRAARKIARIEAQIRELLPEAPRLEDRLYAEMILAVVPLQAGRFGEASASLARSERAIREEAEHMIWELTLCRMLLLTANMFHCGLGRSQHALDAWIAEARRRRDVGALRHFLTKRVLGYLADDDLEGARAAVREVERLGVSDTNYADMERAAQLYAQVFTYLYESAHGGREGADARALVRALEGVLRSTVGRNRGMRATAAALLAGLLLQERHSVRLKLRLDRRIERLVGELISDRADYSLGFARTVEAALAHQRGKPARAAALLEGAMAAFERVGMRPAYASARARLGQIQGGAQGLRNLEHAYAELRALGVRDPQRYLALHAPGFHFSEPS